jgi:hypothetical protein
MDGDHKQFAGLDPAGQLVASATSAKWLMRHA